MLHTDHKSILKKDHTSTNACDDPFANEVVSQKKKKRKKSITVCTVHCRFDVVRRVTAALGMKDVDENEPWDVCFSDNNITIEKSKDMKRFQRINHFPGMIEICRKDFLARNLNRMHKCFPQDYNFYPKTWCLPCDLSDALMYSRYHKNKTFIIKPECGSQGRGIFLTKSLKDINPAEKYICQLYITKPYLINGYKFDIRVYSLITSCDPFSIFVYNEGLVRFATTRYCDPNQGNCANIFMHLTNYAINKQSDFFIADHESGSKRKISALNRLLEMNGVNIKKMWNNIDEAIVKTLISAWPILKHNYHTCFASHDTTQACFEILGFDILLDHRLQPYLLEANQSPSFHTDSKMDKEVKESLLADTLGLLNIWQYDKRKMMEEDRRRVKERLLHGYQNYRNSHDYLSVDEKDNYKEREKLSWQEQMQWENNHIGNYRRVYPDGEKKYLKFFEQPASSLFLSTTSSRARGECVKQQRNMLEAKEKMRVMNRLPSIVNNLTNKDSNMYENQQMKQKLYRNYEKKIKLKNLNLQNTLNPAHPMFNLLDCTPITESEEKRRLSLLYKRSQLIENHGITEIIHNMMREVGTLRPMVEKK